MHILSFELDYGYLTDKWDLAIRSMTTRNINKIIPRCWTVINEYIIV